LPAWRSGSSSGRAPFRRLHEGEAVARGGTEHWRGTLVGVIGNLAVARYKLCAARPIQSAALHADARRSWLDVLSSVGTLGGLLGIGLRYRWADPVAGGVANAVIVHVGWEVLGELTRHLIDGVALRGAVRDGALAVPGIAGRDPGRGLGGILELEVDRDDAAGLTVAEAGRRTRRAVADAVHARVAPAPASHLRARPAGS